MVRILFFPICVCIWFSVPVFGPKTSLTKATSVGGERRKTLSVCVQRIPLAQTAAISDPVLMPFCWKHMWA